MTSVMVCHCADFGKGVWEPGGATTWFGGFPLSVLTTFLILAPKILFLFICILMFFVQWLNPHGVKAKKKEKSIKKVRCHFLIPAVIHVNKINSYRKERNLIQ